MASSSGVSKFIVTSALASAVLEWILIALLLIDGLFAYAIARFADHFGLSPPCLLCSRLDRLFHAEEGAWWLRGVLCGAHAAEISGMEHYYLHHRSEEGQGYVLLDQEQQEEDDHEQVEPSSTIEQLRSKLQAMHAELEEERSAAAVATNQTMAMINRLQEEKAAVQMEALQYQRMMEEQSEYDQDAMQLLTDLVTTRDREKHELERQLELCVMQQLEKRTAKSSNGNGSSDDDYEHSDDDYCEHSIDGVDLRRKDEETTGKLHLGALDDSLTYFEMERMSILDELKALEERLFTLEEDDDLSLSHNGLPSPSPANGLTGDDDDKPKHHQGRRTPTTRKGRKSLLPLFDDVAAGDRRSKPSSPTAAGDHPDADADDSTFPEERERVAIIEEVDHVYGRLQALEADKEFLRHCIRSLRKGEKGMHLLREILQHLRELRSVELDHGKNAAAGDGAVAADSAC